MPDLKISQLPAASTPLAGTELVPVVQGGITEQTPVQSLLTSTVPSGTANGVMYLNSSKVATTGSALSFDGTKLEVSGTVAGPVIAQVTNLSLDSAAIARLRLDAQGGTWFIDNNRTGGTLTIGNASERMRLDASGNLGIGTSSPTSSLDVSGALSESVVSRTAVRVGVSTSNPTVFFERSGAPSTYKLSLNSSGALEATQPGIGVRSTLDASGNLGIGTTSPASKLHVVGDIQQDNANYLKGKLAAGTSTRLFGLNASNSLYIGSVDADHTGGTLFVKNGATQAQIDASGNLGLGVTPSAWRSDTPGFEIGVAGVGFTKDTRDLVLLSNAYWATGGLTYAATAAASRFDVGVSGFKWYTAPSGTMGNAISFTQAMTLDASGNLGIGTTSVTSGYKSEISSSVDGNANALILRNPVVPTTTSQVTLGFAPFSSTTHPSASIAVGQGNNNSRSGYIAFATRSTNTDVAPTERARIDSSGNFIHQVNGTAPSLSTNSTMSFELTSNTSLKIVVRGTDGVTRSASLTLA